jgi:hypothetical protein
VWEIEELVSRALAEPMPEPSPLAPVPSPEGWRRPEQLGLFEGLPGVLPKLLPPSSGGAPAANDNAGLDAPAAPALPAVEVDSPVEDDEAPETVRDPAPGGADAAPGEGWYTLQEGPKGGSWALEAKDGHVRSTPLISA